MTKYLIPTLFLFSVFSCQKDNSYGSNAESQRFFAQGIASGDPNANSVVLWTRIVPPEGKDSILVYWEVAQDETFNEIEASGEAWSTPAKGYSIKVIPSGLAPGQNYFYRFKWEEHYSPIGKTQTLPTQTNTIRLAFVSCSNYNTGLFNAYEAITKLNDSLALDAVVHLGDYIYEAGIEEKAKAEIPFWREPKPPHEILTLADYRTRYQQYREDAHLQKLHQVLPFITIWDDHEIANNSYRDGAMAHDPAEDGDWNTRKQSAVQAYMEWLPIRKESMEPIYRSFQFGNLLNLMMLDTRLCCRTKQAERIEDLQDSTKLTLIGTEQFDWIRNEVNSNNATWNVFGNQVRFGKIDVTFYRGNPIGFDKWPGYPKDRATMLNFLKEEQARNFLFATGDLHISEHIITIDEETRDTLVHEFVTPSISSVNYDERRGMQFAEEAAEFYRQNAPNMPWFDLINHGFVILELTSTQAKMDWYFVSTLYEEDYELVKAHTVIIPTK